MLDKSTLGTRYTCSECGAKFYDLNRPKAICPSCQTNQAGDDEQSEEETEIQAAVEAEIEAELKAEVEGGGADTKGDKTPESDKPAKKSDKPAKKSDKPAKKSDKPAKKKKG